MASIAWSSNSSSARSGMSALHLSPEILNGPKLQLFDSAFAAVHFLSDLPNTFLLHEAHMDHAKLRFGKPIHELEKHGAAFDLIRRGLLGLRGRLAGLTPCALPVIRNRTRSDPQQPSRKRDAT